MSTTPELVDHYKLHPLNLTKDPVNQILIFKTWRPDDKPKSDPPLRTDLTKPAAVESKRFPNEYLGILWAGAARREETDPDQKNVADFAVLLFADSTVRREHVHRVHRILRGCHNQTGYGLFSKGKGPAHNDGEHVTFTVGNNDTATNYHSFIIYPVGVPLGSSDQARRGRWTNKHLTTADVGFNPKYIQDQTGEILNPRLSDRVGMEIFHWFRTEWAKPERRCDRILRVMVYEPATRRVHVFPENSDYQSGPEHTFTALCRIPAEKLGVVPTPAFVRPHA